MPNQEVSNRPLYQAVIYLPFRVIFSSNEPAPSPYPTYEYVGARWPDTSQLISDNSFAKFLGVAIPLNASILLTLGALLSFFSIPYPRLCLVVFGALSPYLLHHAIYTWPKNLAAFYLVLAVLLLLARGPPAVAGLFIGLAYLSHPYAIAVMMALAAASALEIARRHLFPSIGSVIGISLSTRQLLVMWAVIAAVVTPWHVWKLLVLQIPSDMLSQNFGSTHGIWAFVYPRVVNITTAVLPLFLLPDSWASLELRGGMLVNLVSAVGIVPLIFLPWALIRTARELPLLAIWLCTVSGMILVGVFGELGARPLLHGWQTVWPGLLALTLLAVSRRFGPKVVLLACWLQAPVNLGYLIMYVARVYKGA
jgi:hypothetical protein